MKRKPFMSVRKLLVALLLFVPSGCSSREPDSPTTALQYHVRLFQAIAKKNRDYESVTDQIRSLDSAERLSRLADLAAQNADDPAIAALTDSLLSSSTYALYYRQFGNVTPSIHRQVFMALPYRGLPSPGDIGQIQFELYQHRDSLAYLLQLLTQVDMRKAIAIANQWSPVASDSAPQVYFIMDGNGDAFAREGQVCLDLYSVFLRLRPEGARYAGLSTLSTDDIELILAHEFQHIFASPYLYPTDRSFVTWQDRWRDIIIRRLVSEGVAMQCNPPTGFKKQVFESRLVVGKWLGELEEVFGQIKRNAISEDSVRSWLDQSYHEPARKLLQDYLDRSCPESERAELLRDSCMFRPSAIYTLGWWMVSRIVASEGGHDRAVSLLTTPHRLFEYYNAAVTDSAFRVQL